MCRTHLEVHDKGKGIPAIVVETFQGAAGSMGIGLSGIRERACHLGGELQLSSSEEGTIVSLKIPVEISTATLAAD